jgi:hypothetical protein
MKIALLSIFYFLSIFHCIGQDAELSLYNSKGTPVAYIDLNDEDLTIYLWSGKPVAYMKSDGEEYHIYGFNGTHLGWFSNGIVRSHKGYAVGAIKEATSGNKSYETYKSYKQYKPYKYYQKYAPYKPYWKHEWSNETLTLFLSKGRN